MEKQEGKGGAIKSRFATINIKDEVTMEMKIKDDKFFVLETGEDKWVYDSESTAIKSMKELISERRI